MSHRFVRDLHNGETVRDVYLVAEKQLRANRNGNLYIQMDMRDRTGTVAGRLWNATDSIFNSFDTSDYLKINGKAQVFQGAMQIIVNDFEVLDPKSVDVEDFLPHSEKDLTRLTLRVRELLQSVKDPHLQALCEAFMIDEEFVQKFSTAPAGIKNHHAYVGGLLEHVVSLMEVVARVSPLYPQIDGDILLLGAFLHDIGKIDELSYEKSFFYTDEGQLIGHLVMGVNIVEQKIAEAERLLNEPFPQELALHLKHLIVSHHGSYEFGSPKLPMTLEALALNHLDNLDAKISSFHGLIMDDRDVNSNWTPYNPSLGRKLYKGARKPTRGANEDG